MPGHEKEKLQWALEHLGCSVEIRPKFDHKQSSVNERGSGYEWFLFLPQDVFGGGERFYHNKDHRYDMTRQPSPEVMEYLRKEFPNSGYDYDTVGALHVIVGALHDIVYAHVDANTHPRLREALKKYIDLEPSADLLKEGLYFPRSVVRNDPMARMVFTIFDVPHDKGINVFEGLNEFLSAIATAKMLDDMGVSIKHIMQIVHGIAGTIPWQDQSYFPILEDRLRKANMQLKLPLNEEDIKVSTVLATEIANRDVESFAYKDFKRFVNKSLQVSTELSKVSKFDTPSKFFTALSGAVAFYEMFNNPNSGKKYHNIFHRSGKREEDHPSSENYASITNQAEENIKQGILYMKAKRLSVGIVASLANYMGEDNVPLIEFVEGHSFVKIPGQKANLINFSLQEKAVLGALQDKTSGRVGTFEVGETPIGAFIFEKLGAKKTEELYSTLEQIEKLSKQQHAYDLKDHIMLILRDSVGEENFEKYYENRADQVKDALNYAISHKNEFSDADLKYIVVNKINAAMGKDVMSKVLKENKEDFFGAIDEIITVESFLKNKDTSKNFLLLMAKSMGANNFAQITSSLSEVAINPEKGKAGEENKLREGKLKALTNEIYEQCAREEKGQGYGRH